MKYHYLTLLGLMTSVFTANAQSASGGKVVWGPTPIEARISYGVETSGFNLNKFSYSGVEDGSLYLTNKTSHQLLVSLSCEVKDYCNKIRNFSFEFNLPPNATKEQSLEFDASPCITVKAVGDLNTVIYNIYVIVDNIVDLTEQEANEKQRLANEKEAASAKENERLAAQKKLADAKEQESLAKANQVSQTPESATSNGATSNSTQTTNTYTPAPTQSTYEETNARINAENQRKYEEQQERYAENQRINQEQSEQFVEDASELIGMVGGLFNGDNKARDKKEAAAVEERRINAENAEAKKNHYLATIYDYKQAAATGDRVAIEKMGDSYLHLDQLDEALQWLQKGVDLKYPESMFVMSKVYEAKVYNASVQLSGSTRKETESENWSKAYYWLEQAVLNGSVEAMQRMLYYDTGYMNQAGIVAYTNGDVKGIAYMPLSKADKYLNMVKAAEDKGYHAALNLLGSHFSALETEKLLKKARKKRDAKDMDEAIALYKDAADNYYSDEAMWELGQLLWDTNNTANTDKQNIDHALKLWTKAADLGNENAMLRVAEIHRDGNGVSAYKFRSDYWFRKLEESKLYGPYIYKKSIQLLEASTYYSLQIKDFEMCLEAAELGNLKAMALVADHYDYKDAQHHAIWEKRANAYKVDVPYNDLVIFLPDKALFAFVGEYKSPNNRVYLTIKKRGHYLEAVSKVDGEVTGEEAIYPIDAVSFYLIGDFELHFQKEAGIFNKILFKQTTGDKVEILFERVN